MEASGTQNFSEGSAAILESLRSEKGENYDFVEKIRIRTPSPTLRQALDDKTVKPYDKLLQVLEGKVKGPTQRGVKEKLGFGNKQKYQDLLKRSETHATDLGNFNRFFLEEADKIKREIMRIDGETEALKREKEQVQKETSELKKRLEEPSEKHTKGPANLRERKQKLSNSREELIRLIKETKESIVFQREAFGEAKRNLDKKKQILLAKKAVLVEKRSKMREKHAELKESKILTKYFDQHLGHQEEKLRIYEKLYADILLYFRDKEQTGVHADQALVHGIDKLDTAIDHCQQAEEQFERAANDDVAEKPHRREAVTTYKP